MGSGRSEDRPGGRDTAFSATPPLTDREREILRQVARDSILYGLEEGGPLPVALEAFPVALREAGAVFVTLRKDGRLRGCIGSLLARRPLVKDVAESAYAAAFTDPRFSPVSQEEFSALDIHISRLTVPESLPAPDRETLIRRIRPGVDGLILEDPPHRATFLPQVWSALPDPEDFLDELLLKAGLRRGHWSESLTFQRYGAEEL